MPYKFSSPPIHLPKKIDPDTYRRDVLNLPGPVDRWLTSNSRDAWAHDVFLHGYLMMDDVHAEQVHCRIERIRKTPSSDSGLNSIFAPDPDVYTLYLTATISPFSNLQCTPQSPCVILERHIGSAEDLNAPDWMRWPRNTLEFRQPRDSLAIFFVSLATWDENLEQPKLSRSMLEWAQAISAGTWVEDIWTLVPQKQGSWRK